METIAGCYKPRRCYYMHSDFLTRPHQITFERVLQNADLLFSVKNPIVNQKSLVIWSHQVRWSLVTGQGRTTVSLTV